MDYTNEMKAVEVAVEQVIDTKIRELNDLQLAVAGGGSGEITTY